MQCGGLLRRGEPRHLPEIIIEPTDLGLWHEGCGNLARLLGVSARRQHERTRAPSLSIFALEQRPEHFVGFVRLTVQRKRNGMANDDFIRCAIGSRQLIILQCPIKISKQIVGKRPIKRETAFACAQPQRFVEITQRLERIFLSNQCLCQPDLIRASLGCRPLALTKKL